MPEKMSKLLDSIGFEWQKDQNIIEILKQDLWKKTCTIQKIETLFIKHEPIKEDLQQANQENTQIKAMENKTNMQKQETSTLNAELNFDDFLKVEMKIGTIKECELIPGSDKLLKLQVDFGQFGMRQILSGIQKYYTPEALIGTQGLFVVNLKPRKMLGIDSQGMILTAKDDSGKIQILIPHKPIKAGAVIG